jgi:hypothetical protein
MSDDPIREALYDEPETHESHAATRLWLANTLIVGLFLVSVFNGDALERWAASQAPNWANETLRLTSQIWADRMEMAGLHEPKKAVEATWDDWKNTDWDDIGIEP